MLRPLHDPAVAKTIFLAALERVAGERDAYVAEACGGDTALRERVLALLAADARATAFPGEHAVAVARSAAGATEGPGDVVDRYRLVDCIGEGGFGTVWRAEQQAPVRREVALKIVKRGMDSDAIVARFDQERQALAVMDHPNIARILDAGQTAVGRPYFAMELVRGKPITGYCDERRLDPEARLRLFVPVCHALQHAHHKGVVHRDIKPSNVLVAEHADGATPKVIDFGIAKALHGPLRSTADGTSNGIVSTARCQLIGTPDYMAPEQAELSTDVDTRADVYSLGVLLYELLTGTLPFDVHTLAQRGLPEVMRVIREQQPPRPSTRTGTAGADGERLARLRATDAVRLGRRLRGDLDWIVMKALEKDRDRRYATPVDLAADIERHLAHEPVSASPPSVLYRTRKLVRRYRGGFAAAAAVLLALVAGTAGTAKFAIDAARYAAAAEARQAEFDQVTASVLLDDAVAAEAALHELPAEDVAPLQRWLREYDALASRRPAIERTVASLRSRALPATAAELAADLAQHPRRAEWEALAKDLASEARAQAVRDGAAWTERELPPEVARLPAMQLAQEAWKRVALAPADRSVHGEDDVALAMARAALAQPPSPMAPGYWLLSTLALALARNGLDDEALQAMAQALDAAPANAREHCEVTRAQLIAYVDGVLGERGRERRAARERELALLDAQVRSRTTFRFADPAQTFLHRTLCGVLDRLRQVHEGPRVQVERRLQWMTRVRELTEAHPNARTTWERAAAAVADPAGRYGAAAISLRPQPGLVPIGANPRTGLWEFYDLRSAWDGTTDPGEIPIPGHDAEGRIAVTGDTGIVFVLMPGGTVLVGAQPDPAGPHHDADAGTTMGPVRTVTLAPFFLARHEVTQGQWRRLWLGARELASPSRYGAGTTLTAGVEGAIDRIELANPVEHVDWFDCDRLLRQHAMALPTTAQWEYACRARSITPWACAEADLARHANLSDAAARAAGADWGTFEPWNDGHAVHTAVGRYTANAFGMHDMHGNVWEWCSDHFGEYTDANGRPMPGDACRGIRGGGFTSTAAHARASFHRWPAPVLRSPDLGLRASRALQR